MNWKKHLITAAVAVAAVYLYNTFLAPRLGTPVA